MCVLGGGKVFGTAWKKPFWKEKVIDFQFLGMKKVTRTPGEGVGMMEQGISRKRKIWFAWLRSYWEGLRVAPLQGWRCFYLGTQFLNKVFKVLFWTVRQKGQGQNMLTGQLFPCPHVSGRGLPPHNSAFPLSPFTCWTHKRPAWLVDLREGLSVAGPFLPLSGLSPSRGCLLGLLRPQEQHTCRGPGDSFLGSDWKSISMGPN